MAFSSSGPIGPQMWLRSLLPRSSLSSYSLRLRSAATKKMEHSCTDYLSLAGGYKLNLTAVLHREQPALSGRTHHSSVSGEMESSQALSLLSTAPLRVSAEAATAGVHAGDRVPLHVDQQHSCRCIYGADSAGSVVQSEQGDASGPLAVVGVSHICQVYRQWQTP